VRSISKFPTTLKNAGVSPLVLDLDASDEIVKRAAEDAIRIYGHVDVLVNNAGTTHPGYGPVEEVRYVSHRQLLHYSLRANRGLA
jgi:NAD(P)-dependent dehydrogenase (short-subunit alcohol dehydrogenase family)